MSVIMDIAKVTAKGQVTIPNDVRQAIGVNEGEKIMFVQMDDGSVMIRSSNLKTIARKQINYARTKKGMPVQATDPRVAMANRTRRDSPISMA